jgi:DNA-binding beta-propeller fold protein YncE
MTPNIVNMQPTLDFQKRGSAFNVITGENKMVLVVKKGLILFTLLFFISPIQAAEKVEPLASITGGPTPFVYPTSMFLDYQNKRIYVADAGASMLLSFTDELAYLAKFASPELLETPVSLVKDSRGVFYLIEATSGRLVVLKPKIKTVDPISIKGMVLPAILSLNIQGDIYVGDKGTGKVFILNNMGKLVTVLRLPFEGGALTDLWVAEGGKIYTVNPIARKVYVFGPGQANAQVFGEPGDQEGHFLFPVSVCVVRDKIWVADSHRHKILVFNITGHFLYEFGREGLEEGMLSYPIQVRIDWQGRILVLNRGTRRIEVFKVRR